MGVWYKKADCGGWPFCFMDRYDAFTVAGLVLLAFGLYWIYAPLAAVVPGVFLVVVGVVGAWGKGNGEGGSQQ